MIHPLRWLLLIASLLGVPSAAARGDGGRLVLSEQRGPYRFAVFVSPDPPRAGVIDVSVLVQDAQTGAPVADALVTIRLSSGETSSTQLSARATHEAATNKLLRAAFIQVPRPGSWNALVSIDSPQGRGEATFSLEVAPALPSWLTVWPWFAWPGGAIGLFGIHRYLVARRRQAATARRCGPVAQAQSSLR